jgi:hypothetical protein
MPAAPVPKEDDGAMETLEGTLREQFFESCRAPLSGLDELSQLILTQALDEEELRQLRQGLREGVDSGAWATRILTLETNISVRTTCIAGLS